MKKSYQHPTTSRHCSDIKKEQSSKNKKQKIEHGHFDSFTIVDCSDHKSTNVESECNDVSKNVEIISCEEKRCDNFSEIMVGSNSNSKLDFCSDSLPGSNLVHMTKTSNTNFKKPRVLLKKNPTLNEEVKASNKSITIKKSVKKITSSLSDCSAPECQCSFPIHKGISMERVDGNLSNLKISDKNCISKLRSGHSSDIPVVNELNDADTKIEINKRSISKKSSFKKEKSKITSSLLDCSVVENLHSFPVHKEVSVKNTDDICKVSKKNSSISKLKSDQPIDTVNELNNDVSDTNVNNTQKHKASEANICISGMWVEKKDPLPKDLSKLRCALRTYFNRITKAVLNPHLELCTIVLEDLKLNNNILDLVPHFVGFVTSEALRLNSDFLRLSTLLKVIHSLLINPCLYFDQKSHLNTMTYLLLKCLLHPLEHFNLSCDKFLLKDTIGQLLSRVLKRNQSKKLWFEVMFILEAALCDKQRSLVSHYGVLFALNSIGVAAIRLVLLPHIKDYLKHLISLDTPDYPKQCNIYAVRGQLMLSYHLLCSEFLQSKAGNSVSWDKTQHYSYHFQEIKESEIHLTASFPEYFGDSLDLYFPLLNLVSCNVHGKQKKPQSSMKHSFNRIKSWVHCNDNAGKSNLVSKLKDPIFDYRPIKKQTIKFGKLN